MNLRSPGIKPKHLPGRNHPNPLPRIRQPSKHILSGSGLIGNFNSAWMGDNDLGTGSDSPLTSPTFKSSPISNPSTPITTTAGATVGSPREPDKVPVILPHAVSGAAATSSPGHLSMGVAPSSIPPPLPPKPPRYPPRMDHDAPPLVPMRQSSPPPPPLPPRREQHTPNHTSWRDSRTHQHHNSTASSRK